MSEPSTQQTIREAAWDHAIRLHRQWSDAQRAASGGAGGAGYRDPMLAGEARILRTTLDALIEEHGFTGTRVDPMLSWADRQNASWQCPEVQP